MAGVKKSRHSRGFPIVSRDGIPAFGGTDPAGSGVNRRHMDYPPPLAGFILCVYRREIQNEAGHRLWRGTNLTNGDQWWPMLRLYALIR